MDKDSVRDYIVLGGGPAGIQLGYYLEKAGEDYVILEAGPSVGTFFRKYPRHRTLISINKCETGYDDPDLNLRYDWNSLLCDNPDLTFKRYSTKFFPPADKICAYFEDFAEHYQLNVTCDTRITRIGKDHTGVFALHDENGNSFHCRNLIVATGLSRPYTPDITGFEHVESYCDVSVDPEDFRGQRVLILGKGNSAFETAEALTETTSILHVCSPHRLRFAWQTKFVGDLRAVNNNFLDTYQLKSQNAVLDADVREIAKREDGGYDVTLHYSFAQDDTVTMRYDRVIACTGFRFDASIFADGCEPELAIDGRFPALEPTWESTNIANLYFTGVITQSRDYKKTTSAFIHGFRYNARALFHFLMEQNKQESWPAEVLEEKPERLTAQALDRFSTSSGLWQQFGFLTDVIVPTGGGTASYFEELPTDEIIKRGRDTTGIFYTLALEFGSKPADVFAVEREPNSPDFIAKSPFLHPVIRCWKGGELVEELHLIEDLFGKWQDEELHRKPLTAFFARTLETVDPAIQAKAAPMSPSRAEVAPAAR